jgi:hypothetical protein
MKTKLAFISVVLALASSLYARPVQESVLQGGGSAFYAQAKLTSEGLASGEALVISKSGFFGAGSQKLMAGNCEITSRGSFLINHLPEKSVSILCLTGRGEVALPGAKGAFAEIKEGEYLLVPAAAQSLPKPATVRLSSLAASHGLVLQRQPEGLAAAIARQEKRLAKGKLIASGVTLQGTKATVAASSGGGGQNNASNSSGGSSSSSSSSSSGGSASSGGGGTALASAGGGAHCSA